MKLPLIRLGITLALGSIIASAVHFYVAIGTSAADLDAPLPTTARPMADWFLKDFLFKGSIPEIMFWMGVALTLLGAIRLALKSPRPKRPNHT